MSFPHSLCNVEVDIHLTRTSRDQMVCLIVAPGGVFGALKWDAQWGGFDMAFDMARMACQQAMLQLRTCRLWGAGNSAKQ